jgi:glycosyltransferase involved in cell wall biosynthesis
MKDTLVASGYDPAQITVTPTVTELPALPEPCPTPERGTVLYVGQITEEKGLAVLLRALHFVQAAEWRLVIAGRGYAESAARYVVHTLRVDDRVEFRGWVGRAELSALYLRAVVVAVPTIYPEPLGLVGPEAMAHGRPVVAFDAGGVRQWLHDGVTGLLVTPSDTRGFAAAIERLLQEPTLAEAFGRAGREIVMRDFEPQRHIDVLLHLYEQAQGTFQERRGHANSLCADPS